MNGTLAYLAGLIILVRRLILLPKKRREAAVATASEKASTGDPSQSPK